MRQFLKRLMGSTQAKPARPKPETSPSVPEEHALIVDTVGVRLTLEELLEVQYALEAKFEASGVGMVDGHEIALDGSHGILYMYGDDADTMFLTALPVLRAHRITASGRARLRFGDVQNANARELNIMIAEAVINN